MEPVGRRSFARTLGLLGLLSVGVEAYKETTKIVYRGDEFPTKDLEKQLENKPVLELMATYGTPKPKPTYNMNHYMITGWGQDYVEGTKKKVSVQIVPGPDGKLYVKENDTWRKL
jgi:hypothetical protein